ncbi:hypothetical protein ACUXST_002302 [Sphingomonas sp. F9_3S_D5_B_2]|jgi:hypothetical protein
MDYKKLGFGLGIFSIGLGLVEVLATKRVAKGIGVEGGAAETTIRLFGARELLAGGMLLRGPAVSTNVWNRVIGDIIDLGALVIAAPRTSRPAALAGAIGFVAGATALDVYAARGLDTQTGRTWPRSERAEA